MMAPLRFALFRDAAVAALLRAAPILFILPHCALNDEGLLNADGI